MAGGSSLLCLEFQPPVLTTTNSSQFCCFGSESVSEIGQHLTFINFLDDTVGSCHAWKYSHRPVGIQRAIIEVDFSSSGGAKLV